MSIILIGTLGIVTTNQNLALATPQQKIETPQTQLKTLNQKTIERKLQPSQKASRAKAPDSVKARGIWVKEILIEAGFRGEALRTAWAVVMKESTGRPTAYNGNEATGDKSYGIFQINMIGDLGPARREKFKLSSNNELFNPLKNAKIAYHMSNGGENWSSWNIDSTGYNGGSGRAKYLEWLAQYPKG
jgi:hypothetical protein